MSTNNTPTAPDAGRVTITLAGANMTVNLTPGHAVGMAADILEKADPADLETVRPRLRALLERPEGTP
jgi:hypothetical protein